MRQHFNLSLTLTRHNNLIENWLLAIARQSTFWQPKRLGRGSFLRALRKSWSLAIFFFFGSKLPFMTGTFPLRGAPRMYSRRRRWGNPNFCESTTWRQWRRRWQILMRWILSWLVKMSDWFYYLNGLWQVDSPKPLTDDCHSMHAMAFHTTW